MKNRTHASASEHWAKLEEAGFGFGIAFLYRIYYFFGRWPFRLFLYPVISYFYLFRRTAREASIEYLHKLTAHAGIEIIKANHWTSFLHFVAFGESLLDKILSHTGRYTLSNVSIVGREPVQAYLSKGQGLLLLTAHIGSLEVSRAIAQFRNIPITILAHSANSEKFNSVLKRINPNAHVNLMQVADFGAAQAITLANKVAAGEVVIIAADRVPINEQQSGVVLAEFLGAFANFPSGAYVLAHLLQCPVFMVFCTQTNGQYCLSYELFSERIQLPRRNRHQALAVYAQKFADKLALQCQKSPLQWFNFYSFWR
jgi:predicted LPLAT superfamily acyltransferase